MFPQEVRIIGGDWRGRKLPVAELSALRPTPNRVRETLFNWLMHDILGSHCLDAFAGTGALGLEALSRGAASATFCDGAIKATAQLQKNITTLNCADRTTLLTRDFLSAHFAKKFDIVFLDPPFNKNLLPKCLQHIKKFLNDQALIYIEAEKNFKLETEFEILKAKAAGNVNYYLLRNSLTS